MTYGIQPSWLRMTALICVAALAPGDVSLLAQQPAAAAGTETPKTKTPDQLDSLVAPMALYPDPLLAQVLAASTYPLEIAQCAKWMKKNEKLTGEKLTEAAAKETWDPSVQALVAFPTALKLLDENLQWTTDLGNAFLDQQSDVMDAVQRMRKKAHDGGKLTTSKEQKVEVKTIESKTIIEVLPSDPEVIYVPSYNPTVVYGAPVYAYPPMPYPPYPYGAYAATAAISFGVGVAMGAMWGGCCGGGYGWNAGWSNNNININNNFQNRYTNVNGGNRNNIGNSNRGNSNWTHDSSHRKAVPYSSGSTAQKFGGSTRDSSGRTQRSDRGTGQNRPAQTDRAAQNRGGGQSAGDRGGDRGQSGSRGGGAGAGQDRMGNRSVDSSRGQSALGGSGSAGRSQASSNRGYSSSRQSSGGSGGGSSRGSRSGGGRRR
jgi:hypothetical protein